MSSQDLSGDCSEQTTNRKYSKTNLTKPTRFASGGSSRHKPPQLNAKEVKGNKGGKGKRERAPSNRQKQKSKHTGGGGRSSQSSWPGGLGLYSRSRPKGCPPTTSDKSFCISGDQYTDTSESKTIPIISISEIRIYPL